MILHRNLFRFRVIRRVRQVQRADDFQVHWIVRFEIAMAIAFCALCHVPYFFRYNITPCPDIIDPSTWEVLTYIYLSFPSFLLHIGSYHKKLNFE